MCDIEKKFYIDIDATVIVKAKNKEEAKATFYQTYGLDPMFERTEIYCVEEVEEDD